MFKDWGWVGVFYEEVLNHDMALSEQRLVLELWR